jgi:hypothetical protein
LTLVGYWSGSGGTEGWPSPADFVDETWSESDRVDLALYLEHGLVARAYMGYSQYRTASLPRLQPDRRLRAEEIEIGSLKVRQLEVSQRWTGSPSRQRWRPYGYRRGRLLEHRQGPLRAATAQTMSSRPVTALSRSVSQTDHS